MNRVVRDRWRALRRMSWLERRAAGRAWVALTGVRLALSILGFRRTQAILARLMGEVAAVSGARPGPGPGSDREIETAVRALDRAARCGPGLPSCLPRALALGWLLGRRGIGADLRIGARRAGDRLEAHAWVEHAGQVLGDDDADVHTRYAAFAGPVRPLTSTPIGRQSPPPSAVRPLEASGG